MSTDSAATAASVCDHPVPEHITAIIPNMAKCADCRRACIDRKVTMEGRAAISRLIRPITDGQTYYCNRCYGAIDPERVKANKQEPVKTCMSCQQELDRLDQQFHQVIGARQDKFPHVNPRGGEDGGFVRRHVEQRRTASP